MNSALWPNGSSQKAYNNQPFWGRLNRPTLAGLRCGWHHRAWDPGGFWESGVVVGFLGVKGRGFLQRGNGKHEDLVEAAGVLFCQKPICCFGWWSTGWRNCCNKHHSVLADTTLSVSKPGSLWQIQVLTRPPGMTASGYVLRRLQAPGRAAVSIGDNENGKSYRHRTSTDSWRFCEGFESTLILWGSSFFFDHFTKKLPIASWPEFGAKYDRCNSRSHGVHCTTPSTLRLAWLPRSFSASTSTWSYILTVTCHFFGCQSPINHHSPVKRQLTGVKRSQTAESLDH